MFCKTQIKIIKFNIIFIIILIKYFNNSNILKKIYIIKLFKYTRINNYIIQLKKNKELFFRLIYILKLINSKLLKIYIKTNFINKFIRFFKFFIKILFFLIKI